MTVVLAYHRGQNYYKKYFRPRKNGLDSLFKEVRVLKVGMFCFFGGLLLPISCATGSADSWVYQVPEEATPTTRQALEPKYYLTQPYLEGREPPLTLRRENQYLYFGRFFPCMPGLFPVVRDFLCIIPTEQVLHYRNLGLYYGLASGTLPLYSGPCLGVKGGCVSCDIQKLLLGERRADYHRSQPYSKKYFSKQFLWHNYFCKITKQSLYKANSFACSLANRDKPVAATLQRKCSGGICCNNYNKLQQK